MDTFTDKFDEIIRPYMDKIDQVRSILSGGIDGVTFPTVVVVGDQSSGKSTLLEALSLVELPKGNGIVTRCPLVLRLRKSKQRHVFRINGDNEKQLLDERKMNILQYIEEETKILAGDQKNVVNNMIELQVEDPNVRDLTVVDLPGIARNPVADQPSDIHAQTTNLIRHFIRQEGCVILCVFPANVDAATVESLTLAREVDGDGLRTIGVITKSDLAPNDDDLCQQLLMEKETVLQLKLGFIAVRNRTTDERLTLPEARTRERMFFSGHVASSAVGMHCLGVDALINRLADLYADRVKKVFPKMRNQVIEKLNFIREQLSKFPVGLDSSVSRMAKYHELVDFYVEHVLRDRLAMGDEFASLVNVLHGQFTKYQTILEKQTKELNSHAYFMKIHNAMAACSGEQLPNFLPHPLLKRFIGEKIAELWLTTKSLVNDCFSKTLGFILTDENNQKHQDDVLLEKLLPEFHKIVALYLHEQRKGVLQQLQGLVDIEKDDPYTMNSVYMELILKFKTERNTNTELLFLNKHFPFLNTNTESTNDEHSCHDMIESLRSYWEVIRKRFLDYVTLSVRHRFIFSVCDGMRDRLRQLPSEQCDFVDGHLSEDAHTRTQRNTLQKTFDQLRKCLDILGGPKFTDANSNDIFVTEGSELDEIIEKLNKEDL